MTTPGDGQPALADDERSGDALVGSVIDGRYRVTGVLGSGAMGTVYRAEHVIIGRPVALKVLRSEISNNPVVARRFEREAFATGMLEHPNCVTASDGGIMEDGSLFLAMELVEGEPLAELLAREGRLPFERAARIVCHVLRGLAAAHAAGIVHRDIKPENVVVAPREDDPDFAKILDFGIAKLVDDSQLASDEHKATQIGMTIGTPTYMSPEQAFGQKVDPRSDIYSTTVMLFELVAGTPPFSSDDNAELLAMHVRKPVPTLASVAPEATAPPGFDALVVDGMAKERKHRIGSAEDYLARLEAVSHGAAQPRTTSADPIPESALRSSTAPVVRTPAAMPVVGRPTPAPMPAVGRPTPTPMPAVGRPTPTPMPAVGRAVSIPPERGGPQRRLMIAGGVVLALVVTIGLLFGGKGEPETSGDEAGQRIGFSPPSALSPVAQEADEMLREGHYDAVIAYLGAKKDEIEADGDALTILAHAHAGAGDLDAAIAAYRDAGELVLDIGEDERMAGNLRLALEGRSKQTAAAASSFVEQLLARPQSGAVEKLVVDLASSENRELRGRFRALADEHGLGDRVDRFNSLRLDLEQGRRCNDRRAAVVALGELGDKRAIPLLENARKRVRRGGLFHLSRRNTNACLGDAIDAAMARLGGTE